MKNIWKYLFLLLSTSSSAQITYEHTYPYVQGPSGDRIQLADIGGNDFKYIYVDYSTNELNLFNLDHTAYATVSVPITLNNGGEYTIGYVTKSLFDCDTNMFEYAILPGGGGRNNFYVFRQDGSLLFERDSCLAPYGFGEFSGSYDVRPIVNTPAGAKLFLAKADSAGSFQTVDVYSLCGTLPQDIIEGNINFESFVKIFPNPGTGQLHFQFQLPDNIRKYELVIYSSSGNIISVEKIIGTSKEYYLDDSQLSSGTYNYTLNSTNKIIQSGKFIISK